MLHGKAFPLHKRRLPPAPQHPPVHQKHLDKQPACSACIRLSLELFGWPPMPDSSSLMVFLPQIPRVDVASIALCLEQPLFSRNHFTHGLS